MIELVIFVRDSYKFIVLVLCFIYITR